jgi:beta-glucosidase
MTSKPSLREKIGQLITVRTTGHIFDHQIRYPAWEANNQQLEQWLSELNLGGVILLGGSCAEIADRTQQLQQWAKTPLLISADIEEGVGQRFTGASWFPPPMALAEIAKTNISLAQEYAYKMGEITAQEALAIGINWILAPVVDINNNPDNPVINVRAFGDNPQVVSQLTTAFIKGTQNYPVMNTAKHFPGHGDTSTDSHLDLPRIDHDIKRLEAVELKPFQEAIRAKVDGIMTAHLLVEAFDKDNLATLSYPILTGQLRTKMGFEGLIVTDALIMGGVAKYAPPEKIAIKALQAGADILLMPENPEVAINSIVRAVEWGDLPLSRIDQSFNRVSQLKKLKGINPVQGAIEQRPINLHRQISLGSSRNLIKDILQQSSSFRGAIAKLKENEGINLIVVDDLLNCDFLDRQTPAVTIPQTFGYQLQLFDQRNLYLWEKREKDRPLILQVFVRGNPFKGIAGLSFNAQKIYQKIINSPQLQGVIIYGSPYVMEWFKKYLPEQISYGFSYGQMSDAQGVVCKQLFQLLREFDMEKGNFL